MDSEALHTRREARRRAVRRRRRAAGLIRRGGRRRGRDRPRHRRAIGDQHAGGRARRRLLGQARRERRRRFYRDRRREASHRPPRNRAGPDPDVPRDRAPPPGAPFPGLYVAPGEFAAQMQALKSAGWHAVTLDQVEAYWRRGAPLRSGQTDRAQLRQRLPVPVHPGAARPAPARLGRRREHPAHRPAALPGRPRRGQIRGLIAAGWELDTQGFSHADLITLDAQQLHYQVAVARTVLQQRYHVPVNWFCYPSGHYDATVIAAVKAAGYTGSTTVVPGWAHPATTPTACTACACSAAPRPHSCWR